MKNLYIRKQMGNDAEAEVCKFLQSKGMKLIMQNFTCRMGEIDLIMTDRNDFVFVEVRYRTNCQYGNPVESIGYYKQRKIIKAATYYLQKIKKFDKVHCRFDVVGVHNGSIEWIKNAFI